MEWVDGMNQAMGYIEDHLDGEVDPEAAARRAACSVFHFQRMFTYITGVTLSEYIRRRRMTAAAFELIDGGAKVVDLALKYGYDSPTAFNRAFQGVHGVSPSKARKQGIHLTAFPRLTFTMSIKGEEAMNFKIERKDAFQIVGYVLKEPMTMEDCFEKTTAFWQRVRESGGLEKLRAMTPDGNPAGILGVSACDGGEFSGFYIAVACNAPAPEGMTSYTVPAGAYAVFSCVGPVPEAMQTVQQRILSEWLPSSGYEYAPAPDIEVYSPGDQSARDYYSEVWLPIVKKESGDPV